MHLPKAIAALTKWTDSTEARWSRLALDCERRAFLGRWLRRGADV
jgi:hypothetical protein